jgi:excisionase family DNA binding protein
MPFAPLPVTLDDQYLTLAMLVQYCGLSERTLRRALHATTHPLPHFRVGGKVLVKRSHFDQWIEEEEASHKPTTTARNAQLDARVAAAVKDIRGQRR